MCCVLQFQWLKVLLLLAIVGVVLLDVYLFEVLVDRANNKADIQVQSKDGHGKQSKPTAFTHVNVTSQPFRLCQHTLPHGQLALLSSGVSYQS